MKLFDCFKTRQTLSEQQFIEAIRLIESYVMRRAVCQEQTRGYWQVFADMAYNIDPDKPMDSLKVCLASQREAYRFVDDEAFNTALTGNDIYALRGVCRKLLERLENANLMARLCDGNVGPIYRDDFLNAITKTSWRTEGDRTDGTDIKISL
jgi:hypothetical protein